MQTLQQNLLKIALLGTERQTQPLQGNTHLQPLLNQLYPQGQVPTGDERETAFLGALALSRQYHATGCLPASFSGTLPVVDEKEDRACIPAAAGLHLRRILDDSKLRHLLPDWLAAVATARLRVPVDYLPALMEQARQNRALRSAISAVIGPRGHWLAAQNPAWQPLLALAPVEAAADASIWEEGNPAQRADYLRQLRAREPAAARDLLAAVWKQEAATVRQELLATLHTGLSLDDEAWLESCLDDRSKGVRQQAAELLGGLPDSAFVQRHLERLIQWLRLEKSGGLLKKLTGQYSLQVDLPESWDKAWLRDGIEEKPSQGKGAKAWWLEQALSFIPPVYWSQHWQRTPVELLTLAAKSDWQAALLAGWETALLRYPDSAWAKVWLTRTDPRHSPLWQTLDATEAETAALGLLRQQDNLEILAVLTQLPHRWSRDFSLQVLELLPARFNRQQQHVYAAYGVCQHLAAHLDPDCTDDFARLLREPLQADDHPFHHILTETLFTLHFRVDMFVALKVVPSKD